LRFAVYVNTRAEELAAWGWPAAQQEAFLRMQFTAQQRHYSGAFPQATHSVVLCAGQPIGTMIVDRAGDAMRLVDIALLPAARGTGLGGQLIRALLDEAGADGRVLRLSVLRTDPAARLYGRLGFVPVVDDGMYVKMEARPTRPAPA